MAGYGSLAAGINVLEATVSKDDYLVGNGFAAADLYVGSQIGSGVMFGPIEKSPAFEPYWARIRARPAGRRANDIDDALMPAREKAAQVDLAVAKLVAGPGFAT